MAGGFGARLRQRREEQAIDLLAIAAQTKIKLSLLEGLERDDVAHWPAGIFRRAYVRAYAQSIGLDPDAVVREFLDAHPEPEELVTPEAIAAAIESGRPGPPTRLRYIVGSALGSLSRFRRSSIGDGASVARPSLHTSEAVGANPAAPRVELQHSPIEERRGAFVEQPLDLRCEPTVAVLEPAMVEESTDVDLPTAREATRHEPAPMMPDLVALARLCTAFGRVNDPDDFQPLLEEAAAMLDAAGVIVWIWDPSVSALRAALAHGYSRRVLAQLPALSGDEENATSAAYRSAQTCVVTGRQDVNGALAVPLLVSGGCAGVLATELLNGGEQKAAVRAAATILAALLAQMIGAKPAEVTHPPEAPLPVPEVPMRIVRAGAAR